MRHSGLLGLWIIESVFHENAFFCGDLYTLCFVFQDAIHNFHPQYQHYTQQGMKPSEDDTQDGLWSTDQYLYQQQWPVSNGNTSTTSPVSPASAGSGGGGSQHQKQQQPQGSSAAGAAPAGAQGRKGRFNEKTTLLNSDDEFQ